MTTVTDEQDIVIASLYGNNLRRVPIARTTTLAAYELVGTDMRVILRHDNTYPLPELISIHQGGKERRKTCRWHKPHLCREDDAFKRFTRYFLWRHYQSGGAETILRLEVETMNCLPRLKDILEFDNSRPRFYMRYHQLIEKALLDLNWNR